MAISNYRAFYKRKYSRNGVTYQEKEQECSQIETKGTYPQGFYQSYEYNINCYGGLTSQLSLFNNAYKVIDNTYSRYQIASYEPSKVFLGKKYYTFEDLFTQETIDAFNSKVSEALELIVQPEYDIKDYYICQKGVNNETFMEKDGRILFPVIEAMLEYNHYYPNVVNSAYIKLSLYYTTKDINEVQSFYGLYDRVGNIDVHRPFVYDDNGNRNYNYVHEAFTLATINVHTNDLSDYKITEFPYYFERRIKILSGLRIYFLYGKVHDYSMAKTSKDNIQYLYLNHSKGDNYITFLIDTRDCDYINESAFYVADYGFFTGNTLEGAQNNASDWCSRIINETREPNDPYSTPDPYEDDPSDDDDGGEGDYDDTSDDIDPPEVPLISASEGGLLTIFCPTMGELNSIASKLWSPDYIEAFKQYFTSPMEAILGLSIVPVKPNLGGRKNVYFGKYNTQVSAATVINDYVIVNCGEIAINRYWGSYLDYSPYTKISIYLPYIGEMDIDPDQIMTKKLGVLYYVNVVTGDIVAVLTANGSIFSMSAGNCVRQLPLCQSDYSQIINTAVSAIATTTMALATGGASAAGTAMAGEAALSQASAATASQAALTNVKMGSSLLSSAMLAKNHYQHMGRMGTGSGQLTTQKPFLTIERPNLSLPEGYKSYVGYPCNKILKLSSCRGFTQIEATKLSIPSATEEEYAEIVTMLTEGVII